jgi:membrane protein implicated in regulation of membrane protease activity
VGHAGHFPHAHAGKLAGGDGEQGVSLIAFTLGLHKAPLPFLLQTWLLLWGVVGLAANKIWMQGGHPFGLAIVPSVLVAFFAASLGTRLTAEVTFKLLPQDETYDVSQDALFGLVGDVAYRVTESTGRILVYDDFGTLHDEHCRVKPGSQAIEKGESAMVVERDPTSGCLLVQITAEPPKG